MFIFPQFTSLENQNCFLLSYHFSTNLLFFVEDALWVRILSCHFELFFIEVSPAWCVLHVFKQKQQRLLVFPRVNLFVKNTSWKSKTHRGPVLPSQYMLLLLLFSCSVVSDSLRPHGLHHTRLPCPSPTPRACSNSCPSNWWCHPTILSSVVPFSSCLQSFPASGSFQMSWLFASGGQSIRVSASASVLPMNVQGWFLLGLTGWISLLSKGLSRVISNTTVQKHQFFSAQLSL